MEASADKYNLPPRLLDNFTTYNSFIGEAQLAKGDYAAAVETLTSVLEKNGLRNKDVLYHRAYAYEKLGDIEAAVKDYTDLIDALERTPTIAIGSSVHREGYGVKYGGNRYHISLGDLKRIRDQLGRTEE